ncbi:mechanosensitive ion channel family protein [Flavobacterium rhizosphaerae]|uniref:Mechanosensitive ion channel family protein n=1 Tax=Flavobacterium rhizosphaerae TaxID=3163298 RepID=A0ABW8Z1G5_9FLAO
MNFDTETILYLGITLGALIAVYAVAFFILKKVGKNPKNILPDNFAHRIKLPLLFFFISIATRVVAASKIISDEYQNPISHIGTVLLIISVTWFLILFVALVKKGLIRKYDITAADNLNARRVYTQFSILERVANFIIVIFAVGAVLMSFDSIRSIGASLFASAGVAGIIIGFSAQKALGTVLAGMQIAITQPIRLDDVVIVEGEWGWIEDIFLTYVVVRIWDKRRLILPTTYFIDKPFQNWTRKSADIMGTVFIYVDFKFPVEPLREELDRLLESVKGDLWDGQGKVLQVTNASEKGIELRALMTSKSSPINWDLRVFIREKLILFIQQYYPQHLPKTRIEMHEEQHLKKDNNTDEQNNGTT